jgi:hypothetical protein
VIGSVLVVHGPPLEPLDPLEPLEPLDPELPLLPPDDVPSGGAGTVSYTVELLGELHETQTETNHPRTNTLRISIPGMSERALLTRLRCLSVSIWCRDYGVIGLLRRRACFWTIA